MQTVNELSQPTPVANSSHMPLEFDVLDLILILAARKWKICLYTVAGFVLGIVLVLFVTPKYTAKAVILPPQQDQSSAALLGQLGALAGVTGMSGSLGLKNSTDLYIGMLGSQSVTDAHGQAL